MKRFLFIVVLFQFSAFFSCGSSQRPISKQKEEWNSQNDPLRFLPANYERTLLALPKSGVTKEVPWSDTYWPTYQGGLGQRWNDQTISGTGHFEYKSPTLDQLQSMTPAAISKLSPAEKFDIFVGNYKYPLLAFERERTSPKAETWEGMCHGWAAAALNFPEPRAVLVKNEDDISIPFGSADIKALLDLYAGTFNRGRTYFVSERCNIDISKHPEAAKNSECRDTNAATFHIILANKLGLEHQGFVADISRDIQVWNHPIYSYESQIIADEEIASPGAAPNTVREVTIKTTMGYITEIRPSWTHGMSGETTREYNYRLELNLAGQIIGGEWLQESRPDFLWYQGKSEFKDIAELKFKRLNELLERSASAENELVNPAAP